MRISKPMQFGRGSAARGAWTASILLAGLLAFGAAHAQPTSAPVPRLSPKIEKQIKDSAVPAPRLSPRSDAAQEAAEKPAEPAEAAPAENPAAPEPAAAQQEAEKPAKPEAAQETEAAPESAKAKTPPTPAPPAAQTPEPAKPAPAKIEPAKPEPAKPAAKPAAADGSAWTPRPWFAEAEAELKARLALRPIEGRARNVILMIGDGMGVATATAIRLHLNQAAGGLGEEAPLPQERFAHSALVKTYTVNAQTGDGAATATAIMSGEKTRSGVLGLDQTAIRGRCGTGKPLKRIGDLFAEDGRAVGYVTTARLTHSTPAAGYGVSVERLWEHDARMPNDCLQRDLAQQLIERIAGGDVDVAMGGGRAAFFSAEQKDDAGEAGERLDGRNLMEEAAAKGARLAANAAALKALDLTTGAPILGLFASGSMAYEHDRSTLKKDEPSLAEMAAAAIAALEASSKGKGYFLMIEGGRIGQASHYGNLHRVVTDGAAFADAVAKVATLTDPKDTLILVTADAAHSLAFNGYCGRGSPVPGLCYQIAPEGGGHAPEHATDANGAPYETAGFLNGPGAKEAEGGALTAEAASDPMRRQRALVPMATETTSAADVPAYAQGPWAHLLDGVVEQHFLFHLMRYAAFGAAPAPSQPPASSASGDGGATNQ